MADKKKRKKKVLHVRLAKGPAYGFDGFSLGPRRNLAIRRWATPLNQRGEGDLQYKRKRLLDFGYSGKTESSEKPSFARENQLDFWTECHGWEKEKSGVGYILTRDLVHHQDHL